MFHQAGLPDFAFMNKVPRSALQHARKSCVFVPLMHMLTVPKTINPEQGGERGGAESPHVGVGKAKGLRAVPVGE